MIEQIELADLGVIEQATLELGPGFTAITGETGAGKTIVVTGLGLLLGARADSQTVREGAAQAQAQGIWVIADDSPAAAIATEAGAALEPVATGFSELYVSRTVSADGRGRARVGGRTVPAAVLSELADTLVVVHGQADQLRLRSAAAQREALDRFGGQAVADAASDYTAAFEQHQATQRTLSELSSTRSQRRIEAELLREQLAAIEAVGPESGEDTALRERAERLSNAEELRAAASGAHASLMGTETDEPDANALIAQAARVLERSGDTALAALGEQLADISFRLADQAGEIARFMADLDEGGPHELAAVQERLASVNALVREHGTLDNALEVQKTGSDRLAELDDDDDRVQRLAEDEQQQHDALLAAAAMLTAARTQAAAALSKRVTAELQALAMADAVLVASVSPATAPTAHGADEIEFLLQPHPGSKPRPVAKSASGGELSRVMLALEVVIADSNPVATFVFDEIDAGIGGAAAIEVGRRLGQLAQKSQVIAVTHLAQVAAFANNHLTVVKTNDGHVTASSVNQLDGAAREDEMVRLLSGMRESDAAREHARELLALRFDTSARPGHPVAEPER